MLSSSTAHSLQILRHAGVKLDAGLTEAELAAAEARANAYFPPDLRELLAAGLPMGDHFPNWRDLTSTELDSSLNWPIESIQFDIQHNGFWYVDWGERPSDLAKALSIANLRLREVPRLIPVYSHRYIPSPPRAAGNPVFSVYQTDIVHYGANLTDYFRNEFAPSHRDNPSTSRVYVRFWTDLVNAGGAA